jgi:hypothetical protein
LVNLLAGLSYFARSDCCPFYDVMLAIVLLFYFFLLLKISKHFRFLSLCTCVHACILTGPCKQLLAHPDMCAMNRSLSDLIIGELSD